MRLKGAFVAFMLCAGLVSCASSPMIQPQINSLVAAERYDAALRILKEHRYSYGEHNDLLYFMDFGLALHTAGEYRESIGYFEKAKAKYDQLYTISVSRKAATWLVNDNVDEYRGEDFERVLINVFQALNFARLGDLEEALVEARDADNALELINQSYSKESVAYAHDAFARLLMGILYAAAGGPDNINNAYISLVKSLSAYRDVYSVHYGVKIPELLKEELAAAAQYLNFGDSAAWQADIGKVSFTPFTDRAGLAQVVVIHYRGLSPIKHQVDLPVVLPDGYVARIVFPNYTRRRYPDMAFTLQLRQGAETVKARDTELVENIEEIAVKALEEKRLRVAAKAVLRAGAKHMALRAAEGGVRDSSGDTAADVVKYSGMLFNVFSEQADLRSWQTLPAQIRMARAFTEPGEYEIMLNEDVIEKCTLAAGETRFIIFRTSQ